MKKLFADGKLKKIEKSLYNYVYQEYGRKTDGTIWVEICYIAVNISSNENDFVFTVRFGRDNETNDKYNFTREFEVSILDGSIDFIVGQIAGAIQVHEELGW